MRECGYSCALSHRAAILKDNTDREWRASWRHLSRWGSPSRRGPGAASWASLAGEPRRHPSSAVLPAACRAQLVMTSSRALNRQNLPLPCLITRLVSSVNSPSAPPIARKERDSRQWCSAGYADPQRWPLCRNECYCGIQSPTSLRSYRG